MEEEASDLGRLELGLASKAPESGAEDIKVTYLFRDIKEQMVSAWEKQFKDYGDRVQISCGDIFDGGPVADALVSPANSFGFMDGGIDLVYTNLFGWQMQERLQKVIREDKNGEVLVGDAVIIPAYDKEPSDELKSELNKTGVCGGQPIKYLISAPTMRVPKDVIDTTNAFLAFRAVILAVNKHNSNPDNEPIRSVLCPGLGTAVGRMPFDRCAYQMLQAFEMHDLRIRDKWLNPTNLWTVTNHDIKMQRFSEDDKKK